MNCVALGSVVEITSSSHSRVQMFPGEILGEGREIRGVCCKHFLPQGGSQPTRCCSPTDANAILTLIQGRGFGHGRYCPLQKTGPRRKFSPGKMRLPPCPPPAPFQPRGSSQGIIRGVPCPPCRLLGHARLHFLVHDNVSPVVTSWSWGTQVGWEGSSGVPWWPCKQLPGAGQSP